MNTVSVRAGYHLVEEAARHVGQQLRQMEPEGYAHMELRGIRDELEQVGNRLSCWIESYGQEAKP